MRSVTKISKRLSDGKGNSDAIPAVSALSNLIQNAIDFSPVGGSIELTGRIEDKNLNSWSKITARGFPSSLCRRYFDKFFSLQRPDSGKKSTGLGLNIVKEIAVLHKGDVKLENRADNGVRANLILPVGVNR
jgi:two-component system, OmpR family, sensor histidine kinase CreC